MLDCLWGLLDGVNDAGLALSLTFGGRPQVGAGFGTLYTAGYRPAEGVGRYHWPGQTWVHSLGQLGPASIQVQLSPP